MTGLVVLDPTNAIVESTAELVTRPSSFDGLVVGFLDNGKPNSDRFLDILTETVGEQGMREAVRARKTHVGRLADPAVLDDLAARCDVVITGVGDCAGCCSCSVQDGIALERRGIPTFVVCTSELLTTARLAAATVGVPDYPFVVIDHPFGALGMPELRERVAVAYQQIAKQQADA